MYWASKLMLTVKIMVTKSATSTPRMPILEPIFVTDTKAAHMLDMTKKEFLELVQHGALPKAIPIGSRVQRWSVDQLKAIRSGELHEEPIW